MRYIYAGGAVRLAGERKGHVCPKCKKIHHWPMYVFAHRELSLSHTCGCGLVVRLQNGKATQ